MRPLLFLLAACSGAPAPAPAPTTPSPALAPSAPEVPEVPAERVLSALEYELLKDHLVDLRSSVRPFSTDSVGLCTADGKSCGEPLGTSPGPLAAGSYLLWAEFRAPKLGPAEGWPVELVTTCEMTTASGSRTSTDSKIYQVQYAGEQHGYRLRLRSIQSPNRGGKTVCDWTLTATTAPGTPSWSGAWTVPAE